MIINSHNYEEFFLLYVDNELSLEDRATVEQFLQQNPHLAEELEMLIQAILPADKVEFEAKELLYKEAGGISLNNYEEFFLLSLDNELSKEQKEQVEKFILKHPQLQSEFTLLAQARLEPEALTFPKKEKLYKKNDKEKPIIFFNWTRISIAAAVIGLIAATWFFNKNTSSSDFINKTDVAAGDKKINPFNPLPMPANTKTISINKDVAVTPGTLRKAASAEPKSALPSVAEERSKETALAAKVKQNKLPNLINEPVQLANSGEDLQRKKAFEEAIASAKIETNTNVTIIKEDPKQLVIAANTDQNISMTSQAVYKELDTRENEEENTFYLGSAEINKTKLKGLFKKAASFFDKKSNNNDGEKTLKIAGFEIKSK